MGDLCVILVSALFSTYIKLCNSVAASVVLALQIHQDRLQPYIQRDAVWSEYQQIILLGSGVRHVNDTWQAPRDPKFVCLLVNDQIV